MREVVTYMVNIRRVSRDCERTADLGDPAASCPAPGLRAGSAAPKSRGQNRWPRLGQPGFLDAMIESFSRRTLGRATGVYNVRATEAARERRLNVLEVTVVMLDDTERCFCLEKKATGNVLLQQVFGHLDLVEKDYFGLQFTESGATPSATNTDITRWVNPDKTLKKQADGVSTFHLGVKFYPPEPSVLVEEFTRYLLCLQLRRLLMDRRLQVPKDTAIRLAAFTVQAELGDYNSEEHSGNYLAEMQLLPGQTAEDERLVRELHKLQRGQTPAEAEANFLETARRLEGYGVASHPARDSNGKDIVVGVTSAGIVVYQNEVRINTFSWAKIVKISFKRKQFYIQIKREPSERYNTHLGFNMATSRAAKALWRCSVEQHGFFRLRRPRASLWGAGPRGHADEADATETGPKDFRRQGSSRTGRASVMQSKAQKRASTCGPRGSRGGHARVTTQDACAPRPAWHADPPDPLPEPVLQRDEETGSSSFLERVCGRIPFADDSTSGAEDDHEPPARTDGLTAGVTVRLTAGSNGKFGFNVGGGGGAPVLISRVLPDTPAHQASPPVREGDQVMSINGKDVEGLIYDQVVQLIRNSRGILTLKLKPYAQPEASVPEEPPCCFVPLSSDGAPHDALAQSMLLLGDGLASGAALRQYDTLLRRLPDEPCTHAKAPKNVLLNRYKDIAPYDKTRVILKNGPNGDYINASYINMEIPSSDLVLTYIAAQGPLPHTVGDFWQMVWESGSTLVVMLTELSERQRAKCHRYWPDAGAAPLRAGSLALRTLGESAGGHFVHREILLKEVGAGGASRTINQLQYLSWPDHGVPEDPAAFIRFTQLCSKLRNKGPVVPTPVSGLDGSRGLPPPMVVHCSAGVGRTGALVLAETALETLRRRQPLYPLDLVRHMRTQRAMCIQNVSQYKFVCESIQIAYATGLVDIKDDAPCK